MEMCFVSPDYAHITNELQKSIKDFIVNYKDEFVETKEE
jgi:hypothetical protein